MSPAEVAILVSDSIRSRIVATRVPAGVAVGLPFPMSDGDLLELYVIPAGEGASTIQDAGILMAMIDADTESAPFSQWLSRTLADAGARLDSDTGCVTTGPVPNHDIGRHVLSVATAMIRIDAAGDLLRAEALLPQR